MDKINVELLSYTPVTTLLKAVSMPYKNEKASITLAEKVCRVLKHESVSEHVYMSFLISGVSRLELQEHMRHRISSTTCESTRFTLNKVLDSLGTDCFVVPEYVPSKWESMGMGKSDYDEFVQLLKEVYSYSVIKMNVMLKRKYPIDFVKYAIPEGYRTGFVWTVNMRSLNNFLDLRDSDKAHFEIARVASMIKELVSQHYMGCLLHKKDNV